MKYLTLLLFFVCMNHTTNAQNKRNRFQRVNVPDSIYRKLEDGYSFKNVNAGRNVFNLSNRNDFLFKEGLYSFQGQGPHFPRKIFIYFLKNIYIFQNEGAFNPKGVLTEYVNFIQKNDLTDAQIVRWSKLISVYLEEEDGENYGNSIKRNQR